MQSSTDLRFLNQKKRGATRAVSCRDALSVGRPTALAATVSSQHKLLLLDTCQFGGAVDGVVRFSAS